MARIRMDRSGEMEIFARVVQEGGFSHAARTLDLTPSAVSKLISRLEERLGARLFLRSTRALTLTDEGEAFYRAAQDIVGALDAAEAQAARGAVRGRLRISAALPFGTSYVAPAVCSFMARHPDVVVDLNLTDDVVDLLAQRVDVAVRMGNLPDSGLMARRLGASRITVCASPDYLARHGMPGVPADLAAHDCLTFNFRPAPAHWPFRVDGHPMMQPVAGSMQVNNGETLKQMALAGMGIARIGHYHVAHDIEEGRLVALLTDHDAGLLEYIHALHVGGGPVPHRVRAFIDHLVDHCAGVDCLHAG